MKKEMCIKGFKRFITPIEIILVWSVTLTGLMGVVTTRIAHTYLETHSYFYDPVSYSFYNARLYARLETEGRSHLAWEEWLKNARHPLRTVPLLLFAPGLLAKQMGPVATVLPMFGIFLSLLGWTVYRRTGYLPYALACMALFCALPGLFSPMQGLSVYWLDLSAVFLSGGAALCLLNSTGGRKLAWLAGFAVLASCAALSRYVAGGYVFVMCAPVLTGYLLLRWRQEGSLIRSVLVPVLVVGSIVGLLAGYFIVVHFQGNMGFYTAYGYALGHGITLSAVSTLGALYDYVKQPLMFALLGLLIINLTLLRSRTWRWNELLVPGWFAIAHLLFSSIVLRVVGDRFVSLYAFPFVFLLAVSPVPWREYSHTTRDLRAFITIVVLAGAVLIGGYSAWKGYQQANTSVKDRKRFDIKIARLVVKQGHHIVWNAYFDEYAWIPTMEAFYRFGELPLPAGQDYFFSIHESVWKGNYPGLTPDEVSRRVYENTNQWVDLAVVFDDPAAAKTRFNNAYTQAIAQYVAQTIRNDLRWQRVFLIQSSEYGPLTGYRNLASLHQDAYNRILRGQTLVLSPEPKHL
jgi:hypothetical protein